MKRAGFTLIEATAATIVAVLLLSVAYGVLARLRAASRDAWERQVALAWLESAMAGATAPPEGLPCASTSRREREEDGVLVVAIRVAWVSPTGAPREMELVGMAEPP